MCMFPYEQIRNRSNQIYHAPRTLFVLAAMILDFHFVLSRGDYIYAFIRNILNLRTDVEGSVGQYVLKIKQGWQN